MMQKVDPKQTKPQKRQKLKDFQRVKKVDFEVWERFKPHFIGSVLDFKVRHAPKKGGQNPI
jgi:hypothetical protein